MDTVRCQHKSLADGGWVEMSFYLQMGNLGSEVSRAREEFCDYFLGNSWGTDAAKMMRYYDQFAVMGRGL